MTAMNDEKNTMLWNHLKERHPALAQQYAVDVRIEKEIAQNKLGFEISVYSMKSAIEQFGIRTRPLK